MSTLLRLCGLALMLLATAMVEAGTPQPFTSGTLPQIAASHAGKPFILGLWSRSCSHCREELTMLGRLLADHPEANLVLLSTDSVEESAEIATTLQGYGLGAVESWVFADPYTERLQYEIDKRWYGELPRTYLYAGDGSRSGHSGRLEKSFLLDWLQKQGSAKR